MTQQADTLFFNAHILTMDGHLTQYVPGALAVQGDSIVAVGPEAEIKNQFTATETIDCQGKVLMPGLVNAHTHVP
jgi:5-methylthioadenosine/S-adenosylhomocysteine deaminase